MPLLENGRVVEDVWQAVADDAAVPADGAVIVSYARWQNERGTLLQRTAPLGVRLKNTDDVDALVGHLGRLALIVLEFPKFTDGRAYSQARLLRERHRFTGTLRAAGQVLFDQLLFMQRCGFDAFVIDRPDAELAWQKAQAAFNVFFQPTGDGRAPAADLRRLRGRRELR